MLAKASSSHSTRFAATDSELLEILLLDLPDDRWWEYCKESGLAEIQAELQGSPVRFLGDGKIEFDDPQLKAFAESLERKILEGG